MRVSLLKRRTILGKLLTVNFIPKCFKKSLLLNIYFIVLSYCWSWLSYAGYSFRGLLLPAPLILKYFRFRFPTRKWAGPDWFVWFVFGLLSKPRLLQLQVKQKYCSSFHLRNKTYFPCLHSLVKTEANFWENSRVTCLFLL